ncbi:hypothetical protein EJ05DRAFT_534062 [Pseudovirgaria hyperparasitica]|uniref:BCAS2 family protein n=1 Tax=Pseudovirgaria hyperparasitica TaxID=470096 RepID=A0A6A6WJT1_9PEZI|nr:uncharacterized protein EJ05DRAFT_534062 [Pseudovirgaria hyperparasitica]KAF2762520.1 hypothetical protein EJ05DRAFT_534062 [Pseudovirgaria hyperparasitica]
MSLINESHDSLIYIDPVPTEADYVIVSNLISDELRTVDTSVTHPLLPHAYAPRYPELLAKEHERIESGADREVGINLSRYEALEAPQNTSPNSDEKNPQLLAQWRETLQKAYASSSYLSWRQTNLGLLEKYGKNQWLIGNSQLEDILKGLETELAETRAQVERIEYERRAQQEAVSGEMATLDDTWKKGIGRVIETEVAVEGLRREIVERKRGGAIIAS